MNRFESRSRTTKDAVSVGQNISTRFAIGKQRVGRTCVFHQAKDKVQ